MGWPYVPIVSKPHPPYDVTLPIGVTSIAAMAVVVHLAPQPWRAAPVIALAAGLATLMRRRWRRRLAQDAGADLYMVLFWPTWAALVAVTAALAVLALASGGAPGPVAVTFALLFIASGLPSAWSVSAFASAAARAGPLPPGSRARALVGLSVWRTVAFVLWPVAFFGVFDTMKGRSSVAALVTALCWLSVVGVGLTHLLAWRRGNLPVSAPSSAPTPAERQYREPQERFEPAPSVPPEPDIRPLMARELRWDVLAFVLVSVPLGLHALLLAT